MMGKNNFQSYLRKETRKTGFKKNFEEEKQKLKLGYQIFLAREQAGMTQSELAKRIGTRQSNISRFEQGNYNFTVEMLEKIAQALNSKLKIQFVFSDLKKAA